MQEEDVGFLEAECVAPTTGPPGYCPHCRCCWRQICGDACECGADQGRDQAPAAALGAPSLYPRHVFGRAESLTRVGCLCRQERLHTLITQHFEERARFRGIALGQTVRGLQQQLQHYEHGIDGVVGYFQQHG